MSRRPWSTRSRIAPTLWPAVTIARPPRVTQATTTRTVNLAGNAAGIDSAAMPAKTVKPAPVSREAQAKVTAATGTEPARRRRPKPLTKLRTRRSCAAAGESLGDRSLGADDGHLHALRRRAEGCGLLLVARPAGI